MPSKLHAMLKYHENMTLAKKENCNCPKCQETNVDKNNRKLKSKFQISKKFIKNLI
jgi:hypothetical protein